MTAMTGKPIHVGERRRQGIPSCWSFSGSAPEPIGDSAFITVRLVISKITKRLQFRNSRSAPQT